LFVWSSVFQWGHLEGTRKHKNLVHATMVAEQQAIGIFPYMRSLKPHMHQLGLLVDMLADLNQQISIYT